MVQKNARPLPSITAKHPILGGKATIFRYRHCGDAWYFRMWIATEHRYIAHSLGTKDYDLAVEKAEQEYIRIQARVLAGEKLFSIKAQDLRDEYLKHKKERYVETGQLSEGRLTNIKVHTRHYLDFVGENSKIQNIGKEIFKDYFLFRLKKQKTLLKSTIKNEQITISAMYEFAVQKGFILSSAIPEFEKLKIPHDEGKRVGVTLKEYRKLVHFSKDWYKKVSHADNPNEQTHYRRLLHDFIVIQANYGFRTGELRNVRWEDVEVYENGTAKVYIRAETTKVRRGRTITSRRGDVFNRIKSYAKYTGRNDYVFSSYRTNRQWNRIVFYRYFRALILEVKHKYGADFDASKTFYGLRHLYITLKLLSGHDPWEVARITGTSLRQITSTYDNVKDEQISQKFLSRDVRFDKDGNVINLEGDEGRAKWNE